MTERKIFSTRIDPAFVKPLKYLSLDLDKSVGELVEEALIDLFKKYKKPVPASVKKDKKS